MRHAARLAEQPRQRGLARSRAGPTGSATRAARWRADRAARGPGRAGGAGRRTRRRVRGRMRSAAARGAGASASRAPRAGTAPAAAACTTRRSTARLGLEQPWRRVVRRRGGEGGDGAHPHGRPGGEARPAPRRAARARASSPRCAADASRVLADADVVARRACRRVRRRRSRARPICIVVLGGDGTLLASRATPARACRSSASTWASSASSPRSPRPRRWPMLRRVLDGRFEIDRRMTLAAALERGGRAARSASARSTTSSISNGALARIVRCAVSVDGLPFTTLPRRRAHRRDADRIDGLLAVGRRPDRRADGGGAAGVADLAAHAVAPAGRAAARGGGAHRDRAGAAGRRSSPIDGQEGTPLAGGDVIVVRRAPRAGVAGALAGSHALRRAALEARLGGAPGRRACCARCASLTSRSSTRSSSCSSRASTSSPARPARESPSCCRRSTSRSAAGPTPTWCATGAEEAVVEALFERRLPRRWRAAGGGRASGGRGRRSCWCGA